MSIGAGPWEAIVRENALRDRPRGHLLVELVDILPGQLIEARPIWNSNEDMIPAKGRGVAVMFGQFGERVSKQTCWWLGRTTVAPDDGTGVTELSAAAQEPAPGFPGGRGTFEATTADFSTLGGPASRELKEPAPLAAGEYPNVQADETPGGIRRVRDDTPGNRRVDETIGIHAHERTEDGRDVRRATVAFDLILERAARVVSGDDDELIAGTQTQTVEGDSAKSVDGRTFFRGALGGRIDLGSLRIAIDAPTGDPSADDAARAQPVGGAELVSLGLLALRAASALGLEGRRVDVTGLEDVALSGGDVTLEAVGLSLGSDILDAAMLAAGMNTRQGVLRLLGSRLELALRASAPAQKPPVALRLSGDVVEVVQADGATGGLTEKSLGSPLLVDDSGLAALRTLASELSLIAPAASLALTAALASAPGVPASIRRAKALRTS